MVFLRLVFIFLLPPLSVLDKGLFAIIVTLTLTLFGWIPGIIAALFFNLIK